MECNCFNVKNDIIYSYYNKFRLCCVEKYIRINDTFNLIPFEIRYKDILHFKNAEAIYYRGKIILVHKNYNIKEHKKKFNIQTPEIFNFINNPKLSLHNQELRYVDFEIENLKSKLKQLQLMYNQVFNDREKINIEIENIELELENSYEEIEILENKIKKLENEYKRLSDVLTVYKNDNLNNVKKYNYQEIKEKNKKLNQEFKRIAKLMKLNK